MLKNVKISAETGANDDKKRAQYFNQISKNVKGSERKREKMRETLYPDFKKCQGE